MLAGVNSTEAEEVAEQSPQFHSSIAGQSYQFRTVSADFSLNAATCSVAKIGELSVDFSLPGVTIKNGNYTVPEGVQVWENPTMSQVLGTNVSDTIAGISTWSGYEVYYPVSGVKQALLDSQVYYYQPSISSNSLCTYTPYTCSLLIWSGLSNGAGGSGGLLQSGTAANIDCPSGTCGSATYVAFWEFLLPGPTQPYPYYPCSTSSYKVSTGDEITPVEENGLYWSGGTGSQWESYIIDWTANGGSGWSCASGVLTYASTAYYSQTMLEDPTVGSTANTLAVFYNVGAIDSEICISTSSCYFDGTPYGNGDYNPYPMVNNCSNVPTTDITLGTMNSVGDFTSTYVTNCGT